jgi:glucuronate isomerase
MRMPRSDTDGLGITDDRLLPVEAGVRDIARELYERVAAAPIISPHGHVPAALLAENAPFEEPAGLLLARDHYIHRMLHAQGVAIADVAGDRIDPRHAWRLLGRHFHALDGTASSYWLQDQLRTVFRIDEALTESTADDVYERISAQLGTPEYRPRALFDRFDISVLATTDDPLDDLAAHERLRRDPSFRGRVVPTFRPDAYIDAEGDRFVSAVSRLLARTGDATTFPGYLSALRERRAYFVDRGAMSLDVGVADAYTVDLTSSEAETTFQRVLRGTATSSERRALRGHAVLQLAGMCLDDGLSMTLHAGVFRNHSPQTHARYGPDMGHDIPTAAAFTEPLKPLLDKFGLDSRLRLILFCIDELAYSREIAPLAGFYPSVFIGAPWWFLDAPDALLRWRSAVTEIAGFYRTSGFIDDTRAFLSIPSRHDVSRRVDAAFLARYVAQGRLREADAARIIDDTVDAIPRRAFGLATEEELTRA